MYDTKNAPTRTRVSHYLRTGILLSAEHFVSQKSDQSAYIENDFLSHKSWTTRDFLDHYATGNGRTVNLANIGLLDRFRNTRSVRRAIESFKAKQIRLAKLKAVTVCRKLERTEATKTQVIFSDRDRTTTNVTQDGPLLSVGGSTFTRSAQCALDVDCVKKTFRLEGLLKFSIDDKFVDAIDLFNKIPGNQDLPFSKPYKIIANWSDTFNWRGQF